MVSRNHPKRKTDILIVDPSNIWRAGLGIILSEDPGIGSCQLAESGESALAKVKIARPDVILLAGTLPDITSLELFKIIKASYPKINAILLADEHNQVNIFELIFNGILGYCLKGVSDTRLKEIIKSVQDGALWIESPDSSTILTWLASNLEDNQSLSSVQSIHLTQREKEVLHLIAAGESNEKIAKLLRISTHTAKAHVCRLFDKLNVRDRVQAAVVATRACLVS